LGACMFRERRAREEQFGLLAGRYHLSKRANYEFS
jgi:hypothetical protein